MNKVFRYELKRLMGSGLFLSLLVVNGIFAWYVLSTETIVGIACTAPFSVWSYCDYTSKTLFVTMLTILLLQASFYNKKQKQVEILIHSTPITFKQLIVIRTAVLVVCFAAISLLNVIVADLFYVSFFKFYNFGQFVIPSLLIMIPVFLFLTALGHLLGRLHIGLIYLLMLVVFGVYFIEGGEAFSLFGSGFFSEYPMLLPLNHDGEPDFVFHTLWMISRLLYLCIGVMIYLLNIKFKPKLTRA